MESYRNTAFLRERADEPQMALSGNAALEELRREYAQIQGIYEAAIREINARLHITMLLKPRSQGRLR